MGDSFDKSIKKLLDIIITKDRSPRDEQSLSAVPGLKQEWKRLRAEKAWEGRFTKLFKCQVENWSNDIFTARAVSSPKRFSDCLIVMEIIGVETKKTLMVIGFYEVTFRVDHKKM